MLCQKTQEKLGRHHMWTKLGAWIGLIVVWVAVGLGMSGCRGLRGSNIAEVRLLVDGRSDRKLLVPGKAVKLDVVLVDHTNKTYSLMQKQIPAQSVTLEASNAKYRSDTGILVPEKPDDSDDSGSFQAKGYTIAVNYFGRKRIFNYGADVTAVFGPEPANVKQMKVFLVQSKSDTPPYLDNMKDVSMNRPAHPLLTPGQKVYLHVEVSDGKRTYHYHSVKPSFEYNLSVKRLLIQTRYMKWDGESESVIPSTDESVKGQIYVLEVEYKGNSKFKQSFRFTPDFAMVQGPDPKTAKELQVHLGSTQASVTELIPGQSLPLYAKVKDEYGRWFYSNIQGLGLPVHAQKRRIPPARLTVISDSLRYKAKEGLLVSSVEKAKEMVGKKYVVTVAYKPKDAVLPSTQKKDDDDDDDDKKKKKDDDDEKQGEESKQDKFQSQHELTPNFTGIITSYLVKNNKLTFVSAHGGVAASVNSGNKGPDGIEDQTGTQRAGKGGNGGSGADGVPGAPGEPGPRITVHGLRVTSLDGKQSYVLFQVQITDRPTQYLLRNVSDESLEILTQGGNGGNGGSGGDGGPGGNGGNGWLSGHAGNGGSGGSGGTGGNGGDGGNIKVWLSHARLKKVLRVSSKPGRGGYGGLGGKGGDAGKPGRIVNPSGGGTPTIAQSYGTDGQKGTDGAKGADGKPGKPGNISIKVKSEILSELTIPANLKLVVKPINAQWE